MVLWLSKYEVYRAYLKYCEDEKVKEKPYKCMRFNKIMDELKIKIFKPKKDQCDACVAHKSGNMSDDEWAQHCQRKDDTRKNKENDKKDSDLKHVYTMNVQAVLICPRMQVFALYFRQKLTVHNFSLYNLKTKAGHCFLWDETEADLNVNVFFTILCKFISTLNLESDKIIVFYSDGYNYQNRNITLSNTFLNLTQLLRITIIQMYLEKRHTQMECNCMHTNIEKKIEAH